jgi:hypothetical protein
MPGLPSSVIKELAKAKLRSFNLQLPTVVPAAPSAPPQQQTSGRTAVKRAGATPSAGATLTNQTPTATPQAIPPAFFRAASNDKRDVDNQTLSSQEIDAEINKIADAVASGFAIWQTGMRLTGVRIFAIVASGGSVQAPPLGPLIAAFAQGGGYGNAVANGLGDAMAQWAMSVHVPFLPWYPAFAAFPGPTAPPTPNVPCPLLALGMSRDILSKSGLKARMMAAAPAGLMFAEQVIDSFAEAIASALSIWLATTVVTQVLGSGRVPTFAPPYVPVGPVMNGNADQLPGGMQ